MQIGLVAVVALAVLLAGEDKRVETSALPKFDELWNYQDPQATEAKFRELLPRAAAAGDERYRLELLTQVARAQGLQQKFAEAHKTLDAVERELKDAAAVVAVRYLLERGRVFNSSQQKEKAKPLFLEAWQKASAAKLDFYGVDAAHMLGIVEQGDAALAWNEKALALAERSSDPRAGKWRGSLYNNIGWTYHDAKKFNQSIGVVSKGARLAKGAGEYGRDPRGPLVRRPRAAFTGAHR